MCYNSENRERKNSLCVKVKFTTNVHSPKEVFHCDHYNTGYAFSPIPHSLCGPPWCHQNSEHLIKAFPLPIRCIQTDNGMEFTNRFTTYLNKPTLFEV